jgi:hypothetical protein
MAHNQGAIMGKAARNELLKLRATFWNNLAVGVTLAGILVPYLQLQLAAGDARATANEILDHVFQGKWPSGPSQVVLLSVLVVVITAYIFARLFRQFANGNAEKIED